MTETFEDRVLTLVREEIDSPTLPEPTRTSTPTALMPGIALAAAVVLIVGAVVALRPDGSALPVRTDVPGSAAPSTAAEAEARIPYLMPADPNGALWREAVAYAPSPRQTFRRVGDRARAHEVQVAPMGPMLGNGVVAAGSVGGRELSTLDPSSSGGLPMGVYWFTEPDGRTWAVSSAPPTEPGMSIQVRELLEVLTYADGRFTAAGPFVEYTPLETSRPAWTVSDDTSTVTAYLDDTWSATDEEGPTAVVRGHEAVFTGGMVRWRETPDVVMSVFAYTPDPTTRGVTTQGIEANLRVANALVETEKGTLASFALRRGAVPERVVLTPPPGVDSVTVEVEFINPDHFSSLGTLIGPDGYSVDIPDGATELWVWAGTAGIGFGEGTLSDHRPACAQRVAIPGEGAPVVELEVDPTCTA